MSHRRDVCFKGHPLFGDNLVECFHKKRGVINRCCRICVNARRKRRRDADPRIRQKANKDSSDRRLLKSYGITREQLNSEIIKQNNCCTLCNLPFVGKGHAPFAPCVDHDHKTNQRRGIIHICCNAALGAFRDSPERCRAAAEYLEKWKLLNSVSGV